MIPNRTAAKTSDPRPINLVDIVVFGEVCIATGTTVIGVPTSPTLSTGAGAPTHTRPNGSFYLRTDGAADSSMYQRISGAWVAIEHAGGDIHVPDDKDVYFGTHDDGTLGYNNVADELRLTVDSADLELATTTAGDVNITAADDINIAAAGSDVDIDAATLTVDLTGAASIDAVGASNVTTDNGNLTIQTTTAGQVIINGIGGIDLDTANGMAVDVLGNFAQDVAGTMDFVAGDATTFETAAVTDLAAAGDTALIDLQTGDRHLTDALGSPATGALTIHTGDSIVDNGAGAATGGNTGAIIFQTGDTNCDDAAGTGGDSGALTIQTGDADSNAGTSGNSGILSLVTGFSDDADSGNVVVGSGNAAVDSGDVYIDVGTAGGVPGDIVIGTTARLIALDGVTKFRAAGGADAAAALLAGVGTTANPATTAVADQNFLEFRTQSSAVTGDARGLYMQLDQTGVGGGGDAVRGRALVTAAGTGGTIDGGSFTLEYNGGSVAGQGTGCRSNVVLPNAASGAGTVWGGMSEFALGGTSFVNGLTDHAIHAFGTIGGDAATRDAQITKLFKVYGHTSTSGGIYYANGGVVGSKAASLKIDVDGVDYWIWLYDAEA